nr:hypothetical protein [Paraburkholderia caribensis]
MKVFPQRRLRQRRGCIDAGGAASGGERLPDLVAQRQGGTVRETYHHGQMQILAQTRKKSRIEQRGLAQPRAAEQDGQHFTAHQPRQFFRLALAAAEEVLVRLRERREAWPGARRRQRVCRQRFVTGVQGIIGHISSAGRGWRFAGRDRAHA